MLNKFTIPLFGKIVVPEASSNLNVPEQHVQMFTTEVSSLGYTIKNTDALKALSASTFFSLRNEVLDTLGSAAQIPNVRVLFNKFPYETPNQYEYLFRRIVGYLRQAELKGKLLSCGHVIDSDLFNLDEFGACPICQYGVDELATPPLPTNQFENISPLKPLELISAQDASRLAEKLLARSSSLSTTEKEFLALVMSYDKNLALPDKCFKETLPFVYMNTNNVEYVRNQLSGATDVLRLATYVSDPVEADLSLSTNTKYKFSGKHGKNFMTFLENLPNLEEDLMRHRERWLRIAHILHTSSAKVAQKYPKLSAAFDKLRNNQKSIQTFTRSMSKVRHDMPKLAKLLATRPGMFARNLDLILRESSPEDNADLVKMVKEIAPSLPIKMLFDLQAHLGYRSFKMDDTRIFFVKGSNRYHLREETRPKLENAGAVQTVIDEAIKAKLKGRESLGRVYVDPDLFNLIAPFNTRGDSKQLGTNLLKGSRYPVNADVIRLFVWWKGHIDVDLSSNFYDEDWNPVGHVSYTNLKNGYAIHSGDIVNASKGATEFIDINIEKAQREYNNARYIVASLISYRGENFSKFPCYAGYMERDEMTKGQLFEPESVATKVEINGSTTNHMTFAFDLKTKHMILMDMTLRGGRFNRADASVQKFKALAKSIISLPDRKPSFYDVLTQYGLANGGIVFDRNQADTIYDRSNVSALTIHEILEDRHAN